MVFLKDKKVEIRMPFEDKPADDKKITIKIGGAKGGGLIRRLKEDPQLKMILLAAAVVIAIMIVYAVVDGVKQRILL